MLSAAKFTLWNRKLHYYLGLYFLFFFWLFAFTGLLLNHPGWTFAEFWTNRKQSVFERQIQPPRSGTDLDQARDLMHQVGIVGEIEWTATRSDPNTFDFRVTRPGHIFEIHTDFNKHHVIVQRTGLNGWGVLHILHTFTGVRLADTRNGRDWTLTTIWALTMDALAVGLILMVLSGIYMWYGLIRKRRLGAAALALGLLACLWFAIGLKLLASS
jgi:hypothetical protein